MATNSNKTQKKSPNNLIAAVNIGQKIKKGKPIIVGDGPEEISDQDLQKFIDAGHVIEEPAPEVKT